MVEVFITNVDNRRQAQDIIRDIHRKFPHCEANFDLQDCDRILRVACGKAGTIRNNLIIHLLHAYGFQAKVLPDTIPQYNGQVF